MQRGNFYKHVGDIYLQKTINVLGYSHHNTRQRLPFEDFVIQLPVHLQVRKTQGPYLQISSKPAPLQLVLTTQHNCFLCPAEPRL